MRINGQIVLSMVMLIVFSGFLYMTVDYSPAAKLMPMVVCISGILLSLSQLVSDIYVRDTGNKGHNLQASEQVDTQRRVYIFCWFTGLIACSILFGILVSGLIFIFAFLRFDQGESLQLSITLSGIFTLVIYLVFELLFRITLFEGLVFQWLTH